MARIAIAVAGGIIGAIIGGPAGAELGFSLGNILGAALFPAKLPTQYGPRLNDKQVTSSAAGEPIPWGYGGFRIAGNIFWADKIKEIKNTQSQSAKGGPSQTTVSYTYTCSFAIGFCEGEGTILRIWADSKLIYDTTGKTSVTLDTGISSSGGVSQTVKFTPTLYTGSQTQGPDPTIQAALGVGLTPGYRGIIYAVFTDFPLADFGNRIPTIRAEISTGNVLTYVKDAYRSMSTLVEIGTMTPVVDPAQHCVVDAVNRIGYFFGTHGQSVMAVDLNVSGSTPLANWAANTVYNLGDQTLDSNGNVQYVTTVTGDQKSGASAPAWAAVDGVSTTDHHVTWMKIGVGPNAVTVLREGLLDPTTAGHALNSAASFGGNSTVCTVDTLGNLWGVATLNSAGPGGFSAFAVRYDPITFKATGVFDTNIFKGIPPGIFSLVPVKVNQTQSPNFISAIFGGGNPGPDRIYISLSGSGGAPESLVIIDVKTMQLISVGMIYRNQLFGGTNYYGLGNEAVYPAIDPNTGIAYYLLNDGARPTIGLTTWTVMKIDPRNGYSVVPVPSWGINAGQWANAQTFSFAVNLPANTTDGYPHTALYDASDNSLLCFSGTGTSGFTNIKKVDCTLGTLIAQTSPTSNLYTPDADFGIYFAPGYKGLVPADGLVKMLDFAGKNIIYVHSSDLTTTKTVPLNSWEPALGGSNDVFRGFGYDVATNSALVTPSSYQPIPLRVFFDRQAVQAESLDLIVSDLLQRAGVPTANIDVTALAGTNCLGYVVARTSDAKAAVQPLCTAFFFDLVESDFKIKAVLRGQAPSQNIPESDLGIIDDQYKLVETITQEQDLPKTVSIEYQDPKLNYQQGKQAKYRHSRVKKAKSHDILSLPITMEGDSAAQVADKYLAMLWAERNMYDFKLWAAKYLVVDPTDVVQFTYNAMPFQARVVKHNLGQNKILEISGLSEDARQYLSVLNGADTQGFLNGTILPSGASLLFILDTPLLQDIDANGTNTGFYYLMSSPTIGNWPGANLYQSSDNFQSSSTLDSDFDEASYGVVVAAVADVDFGNGVLHPFSWDMVTKITVRLAQGTLSSTTELAVLNGANAFIMGNEVMQFQNAVLNGDGTYTLSKLLRGRRGTELHTHYHQAGETFLLLNSATRRIAQSSSVIGLLRQYKAVTLGQTVTSGNSQNETLVGNDLKPYAPAQLTGTFDASHNINISWVRRTRIGGAWFDGVGTVPLSEDSESYDVDVMALNFGGTKQQHYESSPASGIASMGFDSTNAQYFVYIAPFTLVWDDGTVASYNGTKIENVSIGLPGDGPRYIHVHDPNRTGDVLIQLSGVTYNFFDTTKTGAFPLPHPDSSAIPPNNVGGNSGYWLIGIMPTFIAGQPPSYYVTAEGGDCPLRKFTSLPNPNVTYTAAQILADYGYQLDTAFGAAPFVRTRVYQKSAVVGRGFGVDNPTVGKGTTVSGGSDATSILGVPITGTPVDGDVLQYNGTANEWQIVGPLLKRKSVVKTTASLGNGSSETGSIAVGWKTGVLLSVEGSAACRVQLYATAAAQAADAGRAANTPPDPLTQNEILTDVLLNGGGDEKWICSPPLICANMDTVPAQTLYYRITNNSGGAAAITATLVMVPIEN